MGFNLHKIAENCMDKKKINPLSHALLAGLSSIYGAGVKLRRIFTTPVKLPCPVISVGNITVGGSGKTPISMYLARGLKARGLKAAILSRGYKRVGSGIGTVSDGKYMLLSASEAGDEPFLMAEKLLEDNVPVIVGVDRVSAGRYAIDEFNPDVLILDDGFQHIRLNRDLDIVLIDSVTGFGSGYLLPRGPLREPLASLDRADLLMIKGETPLNEPAIEKNSLPRIKFSYRAASLTSLDGESVEDTLTLDGKKVLAVAALARPASFIETLTTLGAEVTSLTFPDHHFYTQSDLQKIMNKAAEVDAIITTEKDAVKLRVLDTGGLDIMVLAIEPTLDDDAKLFDLACEKIEAAATR